MKKGGLKWGNLQGLPADKSSTHLCARIRSADWPGRVTPQQPQTNVGIGGWPHWTGPQHTPALMRTRTGDRPGRGSLVTLLLGCSMLQCTEESGLQMGWGRNGEVCRQSPYKRSQHLLMCERTGAGSGLAQHTIKAKNSPGRSCWRSPNLAAVCSRARLRGRLGYTKSQQLPVHMRAGLGAGLARQLVSLAHALLMQDVG